jgi:hypothetical protein
MDQVRGYVGQLVGLGSKFNGFKPKNIGKKPIIHLKRLQVFRLGL